MSDESLLQRVRSACEEREYNDIESLAAELPDVDVDRLEQIVLHAVKRGLLTAVIMTQRLLDGDIQIITQIRRPSLNYYTYHFIVDGRIVHGGITTDPQRREQEHAQRWPHGKLVVVGGPMPEAAAREWERINGFA